MNDPFASLIERFERVLSAMLLRHPASNVRLNEAMTYACRGPAKRLRPLLVYATGQAQSANLKDLDAAACAVELMHCFSLVHDDLPCMDDDALRRGQPSVHCHFDEATAVLAGNALQSLAFHILADDQNWYSVDATQRIKMAAMLAQWSGAQGMLSGQAQDLQFQKQPPALIQPQDLLDIFAKKTACLMQASVTMGALCAAESTPKYLEALKQFALAYGLAFQLKDDLEEACPSQDALSFVHHFGAEKATEHLQIQKQTALQTLQLLQHSSEPLTQLVELSLTPSQPKTY